MKKNRTSPTRILVTAGPTVEPLDPVRFISNYSTGEMGHELARKSVERGFETCLITGPVHLPPPAGMEVIKVETAREMRDRVMERAGDYDCVIMAAAVCDFRPRKKSDQKIKKQEKITLELVRNPDILKELSEKEGLIRVGFALEVGKGWLENAKEKMETKKLDMIIINVKEELSDPFGPGEKDFLLLDKEGSSRDLKGISKAQCAEIILEEVERML
ncbi:MAG: phosphopantothenoylcysteine decarboxylase [Candidatus Omnitrophota bacterium]